MDVNYTRPKAARARSLLALTLMLLFSILPATMRADDTGRTQDSDGYWKLFSAEDLKWFADEVYNGNYKICGRLYADVSLASLNETCWRPIGGVQPGYTNTRHVFKGKFDGQNHVISGLKVRPFVETGLFGRTDSATIENVIIDKPVLCDTVISLNTDNSKITQGMQMAIVVGNAYTTVVRNCHVRNAILNPLSLRGGTTWHMVGGICGSAADNSRVQNCTMSGSVLTNHEGAGGIVGYLERSEVDSCRVLPSIGGYTVISATDYAGGIVGAVKYRSAAASVLGCSVTDSIKVYVTGDDAKGGDPICGGERYGESLEMHEGYYEIYNPANLQEFASKVNGGETSAKVRLMCDINMSGKGDFSPIGTESRPFSGVFDGGGHTIDSLTVKNQKYAGLFGYVKDGAIKNVKLSNPTLLTQNNNYLGFIAGFLTQDPNVHDKQGYIENCHVKNGQLLRNGKGEPSYVGGIAGKADMSAKVSDCSFQGVIQAHENRIGGIIGEMNSGAQISSCFTICPTTVWGNNYIGGVVGIMEDANTKMVDCFVDQSNGQLTLHAEKSNNSGLLCGKDNSGTSGSTTAYSEGNLQYKLTGRTINVPGGSGVAKETKITGVSSAGQGTYYAIVDIGTYNDYLTTEIENINGVEELYFWDNCSNIAGTEACDWINMKIDDYAFDRSFKSLKMMYRVFAGADHDVMLRPTDVYPAGDKMFANCPDAKVYVDAEYYHEFINDPKWSKYKDHIVSTTSMRRADKKQEGTYYAYDHYRDATASPVTESPDNKHTVYQLHVVGSEDKGELRIYKDIGQDYDYNTTKIWTNAFRNRPNLRSVVFHEIIEAAYHTYGPMQITLGDSCFADCANLSNFDVVLYSNEGDDHVEYIHPNQLPLGKGVFDNCPNLYVYVPRELVDEFKNDTTYGWAAYKDIIRPGDFGNNNFDCKGVYYSYYASADGQTQYTNSDNATMEAMLAPWTAKFRNFAPSKVLEYGNSATIHYMFAKGIKVSDIDKNNGEMRLYCDIGGYHDYKTLALSGNGFQRQSSIKSIIFEDCYSDRGNAKTGLSLVIPDETFKGCENLKELNMFYYVTEGTNHYEGIKPSQIFIGEHVFDGVNEDFRIRVLPQLYQDYINDANWGQYKDFIVAADYLPTKNAAITRNGVTYDYASKVLNGMTTTQIVSLKTSWWTALVIGVEVAITAVTAGTGGAGGAAVADGYEAVWMLDHVAANGWDSWLGKTVSYYKFAQSLITNNYAKSAAEVLAKKGKQVIWGFIVDPETYTKLAIATAAGCLDVAAMVSARAVGAIHDNNTAFNYIANRTRKNFQRPSTWSMTGGGYVVNTEQITNVPHMYVKDVEDRDVAIIYNDCGDHDDDYQTMAVGYSAFHDKKLLEEVKFQDRYGDASRSLASGLTLALPDSMFRGCTNLKTLNLVLRSTGAESENRCYKALTPDNFVPMGDIFAGMDSTARSKVRIKVGEEVLQDFLDDEYWAQYKDMFVTEGVRIVRKQLEWGCNYALAYDKNTLPRRTRSDTHNIDHVCVYAGDDDELKSNKGLAALINDFGEWNNYKLDYVRKNAFKGNNLLKTLDLTDTHTNVADVYDSSFGICIQDSAFAHCHEFENLNLIYQVTDGDNHCDPINPGQIVLDNGVFDDTPKLRIKFCLDQLDNFLADTAWVKYKDKFAPCFFKPADEEVEDIILKPYRFGTDLNSGTNFDYVDATRPNPEDLRGLFRGTDIRMFDEFRAFGSCGLRTIYNGMFAGCTSLQSIVLPDSTRAIETDAFKNCSLLAQMTIPEKVAAIQENAFTGSSIKEFFVKSAVPADIDAAKAFAGLDKNYIIYVADSVVETYRKKWAAVAGHINAISARKGLKVVRLKEAGTLAKELGLEYKYTSSVFADNHLYGNYAQFDSLRVIGPIDGRDIGVIRFMGGRDVDDNEPTPGHLKYLDLYEADLKSAGKYDYNRAHLERDAAGGDWGPWFNNYIENDNEVSAFMFWALNSLETLILPRSATSIQVGAFEHCENLKMLVIGDNMEKIAPKWEESTVALSTPKKVVLVMLGNTVPETDEEAFLTASGTHYSKGDASLINFVRDDSRFSLCVAPNGSIKEYAANVAYTSACDSMLANFEDPALVEALKAKHVFSVVDLMNMGDITGYVNGNKKIKNFNDLLLCATNTLGDSTLTDMDSLETVVLPVGLKTITAKAFKGCGSLRTINSFCKVPPSLAEDAFASLPKDFVVYVTEGLEDTYRKAWPQYKDHIQGYRARRGYIREITLAKPNTLADSLNAKITMSKSGNVVEAVGGDLGKLTALKVSGPIGGKDIAVLRYLGGIEPIDDRHVYTTNLKYLDLYDAELKADRYFFSSAEDIRPHIETDNVTPAHMLRKCDNLETVILPRTATKLDYETCYDMASLKTLVVGDDVTYIDDDALGECRKLEKILFLCKKKPELDGDAFTDPLEGANRKVGKMYVRKGLLDDYTKDSEYYGHTNELTNGFDDDELFSAFGCKALATEDDLASVDSIDGWFRPYPGITNLTQLSKTKITEVKSDEFDRLKGLRYVKFPSTTTTIGKDAFKENKSMRWIDLSECDSLETDISKLGVCREALVYQPTAYAESKLANVVYDKGGALQCSEFYLTDSHGYDVPKAFTAKKVTLSRQFTPRAYTTLALPFGAKRLPSGFKFYTLDTDSTQSGALFFKPATDGITATAPYVVRAKRKSLVIDEETAVPTTPYRTDRVMANGYILNGNLQSMPASEVKALKALAMNDTTCLWSLASTEADSLLPYTAYVQTYNAAVATDDVRSRFTDCLYHYYIGGTTFDIHGDGTADDPLSVGCMRLVDGLDFSTEAPFTTAMATYTRAAENQWNTLCLPYAFDADGNETCEFYELTDRTDDQLVLTKIVGGTVEAGMPVLVRRKDGMKRIAIEAVNSGVVAEAVSTGGDNTAHLEGSFRETEVDGDGYIIANNRFWKVADLVDDTRMTVRNKAFRAYLGGIVGTRAASFSLTGDGVAVDEVLNDGNAEYYDINGRRMTQLTKGLNIVKRGGKATKVIIK